MADKPDVARLRELLATPQMADGLTERLHDALPGMVTDLPTALTDADFRTLAARLAEAVANHCLIEVMSRQAPAEKERDDWAIAYTKMSNRAERAEAQLAGAEEQNRSLQELLDEASKRAEQAEQELGELRKFAQDHWNYEYDYSALSFEELRKRAKAVGLNTDT